MHPILILYHILSSVWQLWSLSCHANTTAYTPRIRQDKPVVKDLKMQPKEAIVDSSPADIPVVNLKETFTAHFEFCKPRRIDICWENQSSHRGCHSHHAPLCTVWPGEHNPRILFSSAFITIPPQHLVQGMKLLGVQTGTCNWILKLLIQWQQAVREGSQFPRTISGSSGFSQGCVLSSKSHSWCYCG